MDKFEEWYEKCMSCTHSYYRKSDADTLYCRCRNGVCNYKKKKIKTDTKSDQEDKR